MNTLYTTIDNPPSAGELLISGDRRVMLLVTQVEKEGKVPTQVDQASWVRIGGRPFNRKWKWNFVRAKVLSGQEDLVGQPEELYWFWSPKQNSQISLSLDHHACYGIDYNLYTTESLEQREKEINDKKLRESRLADLGKKVIEFSESEAFIDKVSMIYQPQQLIRNVFVDAEEEMEWFVFKNLKLTQTSASRARYSKDSRSFTAFEESIHFSLTVNKVEYEFGYEYEWEG